MTIPTSTCEKRLEDIRDFMHRENLAAFILPCADQYLLEYLGPDAQRLRWLTGFTGEAAIAIILEDKAAIFVDGRFTVQVRQQVPESLFEYHHLIEEPHLQWLKETLMPGDRLGFDPSIHTFSWYKEAKALLKEANIELAQLPENPIDNLWHDRPQPNSTPGILLAEELSGCSSAEKRHQLSEIMHKKGLDAMIITQPDSINWLFNIRGNDVPCLPVVLGYAIVYQSGSAELFVSEGKLDETFNQHAGNDVIVQHLGKLEQALRQLGETGAYIQLDTENTNAWIPLTLEQSGAELKHGEDPCMLKKAIKNTAEINGMRKAHLYAGIATCRFLAWLDREVAKGSLLDEGILADKLESLLEEHPHYHGCSFDTISAIGPNAAQCHYNHALETPRKLGRDGMYLIDNGAQYPEGTTDMTRTVKVGNVTGEMRERYTQVLQGHIKLVASCFPQGTRGIQLDTLARWPLWQAGANYDHGTGHGVGHFLSVHESPARMSPQEANSRLLPGMVISIEPGYYKEDCFGIRIENLYLVREAYRSGEITFLEFENLTFAPIDYRLLNPEMMTKDDIQWLDQYHAQVKRMIAPHLDDDDLAWLNKATLPLIEHL
ncbi:aminopeptidase P family protein [Endozoicomonas sp. Mp262]|uniref:aminopeptidase P family protein n=1 Tax=Endozoicomonas sp. Mp262 TaxID=2919499 RepID=UPI0021DA9C03